jgi:hypothetical protein
MKEVMIKSKINPNDQFRVTTQTFELLKSSHEIVVERGDLPLLDVDPKKVVSPPIVETITPPTLPTTNSDTAEATRSISETTTPEPAKAKAIPSPKKAKKNAAKK